MTATSTPPGAFSEDNSPAAIPPGRPTSMSLSRPPAINRS